MRTREGVYYLILGILASSEYEKVEQKVNRIIEALTEDDNLVIPEIEKSATELGTGEGLRQLFRNNSNCYADTSDDSVVLAIDEDMFVNLVTKLQEEKAGLIKELEGHIYRHGHLKAYFVASDRIVEIIDKYKGE